LFVAQQHELPLLEQWTASLRGRPSNIQELNAEQSVELVPILRPDRIAAAVLLPEVRDIDAAALLQTFARVTKARGGSILANSPVTALTRQAGAWEVRTPSDTFRAGVVVNAAGAWADDIAALASLERLGLTCCRRTLVAIDPPEAQNIRAWPVVCDAAESIYMKPEAGRLLICPADRTPMQPHDVQPDDLDVAIAVDRFETMTDRLVTRVTHRWAGLRTMSADGEPVLGFDARVSGFLWAAGFGGFGVQAAFAAGRCAEALLTGSVMSRELAEVGVDIARLSPARFVRVVPPVGDSPDHPSKQSNENV
jgi:D-arginine dehydrogenase